MASLKHFICATSICFSPALQAGECTSVVISADSDYAPLHWYDGKTLIGASIEIATTALDVMNMPYVVRYVGPFHRVLKGAELGEVDMIASLKDTPARREFLAFSSVPLFANPIAVFVSRNHVFAYRGWHDLIGKKGGVTQGYQFGGGFDTFLSTNLHVDVAQKTHMNFSKLDAGTIDYVISGYHSGMAYLEQSRQTWKFIALKPYISDSQNFLAISRRSPCMSLMPRLNEQLDIMRRSGKLAAILEKYYKK